MTEAGDALRPRKRSWADKFRGQRNRGNRHPVLAFVIDVAVIFGTALVLSVLIKTFLFRSFYIPSGSMEDTLQVNDRIIVNVMAPEVFPIERGDVVVFQDPGGWLGPVFLPEKDAFGTAVDWFLGTFGITANDSAQHLIKRVIGLPGDTVECCDVSGKLTVNGVPIDEVYIQDGEVPSKIDFSVVVPENSLWLMGDNRSNSQDSRYHQSLPSAGFVDFDLVVGRAILVSWPVSNWTWLDNFSSVFDDVPNP
jgi:signal peptidase I